MMEALSKYYRRLSVPRKKGKERKRSPQNRKTEKERKKNPLTPMQNAWGQKVSVLFLTCPSCL